jgi:hypothetical protein
MNKLIENALVLMPESMIPLDEKVLVNKLKSIVNKCQQYDKVVFELNWGGASTISISIFAQEGSFERNILFIPNAFSSNTKKEINHPDIFDKKPNKNPSVSVFAMTQMTKVFKKAEFTKHCKNTKFVAMYHDGKTKILN